MLDDREEKELYRLVKDNNRLLRSMRRNAVVWGMIKFLFYIGILVVLPAWLYVSYVAPLAEDVQGVLNQVQGVGQNAQNQVDAFQELLNKINPSQYFSQ